MKRYPTMGEDILPEDLKTEDPREDPRNDLFKILANQRGRKVIQYLKDGGTAPLSEVSLHVASREQGKDRSELTSEEKKLVYVALYQSIAPRMDNLEIVEYDSDDRIITPSGELYNAAREYSDLVSEASNDEQDLSVSEVFHLVQRPRRRLTLKFLEENGGDAELGEVAKRVAATENNVPVEELTTQQKKSVRISLIRQVLPKLDKAGVVSFDKDSNQITLINLEPRLTFFL